MFSWIICNTGVYINIVSNLATEILLPGFVSNFHMSLPARWAHGSGDQQQNHITWSMVTLLFVTFARCIVLLYWEQKYYYYYFYYYYYYYYFYYYYYL